MKVCSSWDGAGSGSIEVDMQFFVNFLTDILECSLFLHVKYMNKFFYGLGKTCIMALDTFPGVFNYTFKDFRVGLGE